MKQKDKINYPLLILIGIVLIVGITYLFSYFTDFRINYKTSDNRELGEKENGLHDIVKIGNVSFQLLGVTLMTMDEPELEKNVKSSTRGREYILHWTFEVINIGEKMENISDCGILLFEDGSQQNEDPYDWGICESYHIVPKAKKIIQSSFYSNPNVPSKITYFLQQEQGLVKYVIHNSEIIYTNESSN